MRRLTKRKKDLPQILNATNSLLLSACCMPSPLLGIASSHLVLTTTRELSVSVLDKETKGEGTQRHVAAGDGTEVYPGAAGPQSLSA